MSITALPLWGSCTYRVHTKCGFPAFEYNSESDITGEFDIAYTSYDGYTLEYDINSWEFNKTSDFAGRIVSDKKDTTVTVPGTIDHSEYEDCSSKDRNLYMTVTRIKNNNAVEPAVDPILPENGNVTTPEMRRVLAADDLSNIYFTFTISAAKIAQLALGVVALGFATLTL